MANWLGKWFGSWFGASAPSQPGAISGSASIRVSASATVTAKGALIGSATVTVGASATLLSNTVAPQPTVDSVWGQSWGACWGSAWGFLVVPYAKLSLKGQVFVRSYLTSIHSVEVAERIVSVAALNNISVLDAALAVTAKLIPQSITISKKSKKAVQKAVENYPRKVERQPKSSIAAVSSNIPLYSFRELDRIEAVTVSESFFVSTKQPVTSLKTRRNEI